MNQTHLKYHLQIPRKGINYNSVKLLLAIFGLPAGKGLTSWLSFVVSNCEFVTFPLVSLVRCGT